MNSVERIASLLAASVLLAACEQLDALDKQADAWMHRMSGWHTVQLSAEPTKLTAKPLRIEPNPAVTVLDRDTTLCFTLPGPSVWGGDPAEAFRTRWKRAKPTLLLTTRDGTQVAPRTEISYTFNQTRLAGCLNVEPDARLSPGTEVTAMEIASAVEVDVGEIRWQSRSAFGPWLGGLGAR